MLANRGASSLECLPPGPPQQLVPEDRQRQHRDEHGELRPREHGERERGDGEDVPTRARGGDRRLQAEERPRERRVRSRLRHHEAGEDHPRDEHRQPGDGNRPGARKHLPSQQVDGKDRARHDDRVQHVRGTERLRWRKQRRRAGRSAAGRAGCRPRSTSRGRGGAVSPCPRSTSRASCTGARRSSPTSRESGPRTRSRAPRSRRATGRPAQPSRRPAGAASPRGSYPVAETASDVTWSS